MDNDIRIVKRILRGDVGRYEDLVFKYESKVYRTCCRFVKNSTDAQDIAQEVFIKIYNNLSKYKKQSRFSTWIYRITVNSCLDFLRKNNRLKLEYNDELETGKSISPEKIFELKEIRELLKSELDCLDEKNERIFIDRIEHGKPFSEIAKEAGITDSAARMRFSRTRKKLEKAVQRYHRGE